MTDELRMADDGCTNEPDSVVDEWWLDRYLDAIRDEARRRATEGVCLSAGEIRHILDTLEADDRVTARDRGVSDEASSLASWPLYQRLRTLYPRSGGILLPDTE